MHVFVWVCNIDLFIVTVEFSLNGIKKCSFIRFMVLFLLAFSKYHARFQEVFQAVKTVFQRREMANKGRITGRGCGQTAVISGC